MIDSDATHQHQESHGLTVRQALVGVFCLTAVVLLALPPVTGFFLSGRAPDDVLLAVGLAAGICWLGGILALGTHFVVRDPQLAVAGALGAMLVRMIFVFGCVLAVSSALPRLVDAGFPKAAVLFFLLTLAAETSVTVWGLSKSGALRQTVTHSSHEQSPEVS